jgi:hypothetical protein
MVIKKQYTLEFKEQKTAENGRKWPKMAENGRIKNVPFRELLVNKKKYYLLKIIVFKTYIIFAIILNKNTKIH